VKIGIMSDSHDHRRHIKLAVELFNREEADQVIHAGDIVAPFTFDEFQYLTAPLTAVYGNCDGERLGLKAVFNDINPAPLIREYGGKKFVVMHEPFNLDSIVAAELFDYVIYGHLHTVDVRIGKVTVINPGEVVGWTTGKATVALLDTMSNEVTIHEL